MMSLTRSKALREAPWTDKQQTTVSGLARITANKSVATSRLAEGLELYAGGLIDVGTRCLLSQAVGITTRNARGPTRHASSCDPSRRPNQDPSQRPNRVRPSRHRDKPLVPTGHASSVAPIARRLKRQGRL